MLSPNFRQQRSARLGSSKHRLTAGRRAIKKLKETIAARAIQDKVHILHHVLVPLGRQTLRLA